MLILSEFQYVLPHFQWLLLYPVERVWCLVWHLVLPWLSLVEPWLLQLDLVIQTHHPNRCLQYLLLHHQIQGICSHWTLFFVVRLKRKDYIQDFPAIWQVWHYLSEAFVCIPNEGVMVSLDCLLHNILLVFALSQWYRGRLFHESSARLISILPLI